MPQKTKLIIYFASLLFSLGLVNHAHATNSSIFSLSIWVNPVTSVASKAIIGKAEEMRIATDATGHPLCQIKSTTWQTAVVSSKQITVGTWAHIACTYDLKNLQIYVNGELTGTQALTAVADDTTAVVKIGKDDSTGTPYGILAGLVDDFKFYNFPLNADDIKQDYNNSSSASFGEQVQANNNGTTVTGASTEYCIPGDTATCTPPVLELKMDEKTGGTVYDTSGNGNDGTISGASWDRGKYGSALKFDGVNDYVDIGSSSVLQPNDITICSWINIKGLQGNNYGQIFGSFYQFGAWLAIKNVNTVVFYINNNLWWSSVLLENDKWYMVCGTWNNSIAYIYVNGVQRGVNDLVNGNLNWSGTTNIRIGSQQGGDYRFNGIIDDVKIYNYARTPAQIAWDYNRGKPVAEYRFDECSGSVIHDESGNGNHGTLVLGTTGVTATGTCASSSNSFWYNGRSGKKNGGGSFDGGSDYIDVGDTNLNINSISFWLKQNYTDANIIDLDGGTHTITLSGGAIVATGFSSPTIYVDGVSKTRVPDNAWHHVLITTATAIDANNFDIGRIGTNYFTGQIDDVKLYNYALNATQAKTDFSGGAVGFGYSGITSGSALVSSWTCGTSDLTDIDDNSYSTVLIGTQCWMAENLMTTKYPDGSSITRGPVGATWDSTDHGYYAYPPNVANTAEETLANIQSGKLGFVYQWSAVMHGSVTAGAQGVCPTGWHMPTHDELTTLERAICTSGTCATDFPYNTTTTGWRGTNEGSKLSTQTSGGTNSSGFSALLAGYRYDDGDFANRGTVGIFWSSSASGANAWYRLLFSSESRVYRFSSPKAYGFSVRCIQD